MAPTRRRLRMRATTRVGIVSQAQTSVLSARQRRQPAARPRAARLPRLLRRGGGARRDRQRGNARPGRLAARRHARTRRRAWSTCARPSRTKVAPNPPASSLRPLVRSLRKRNGTAVESGRYENERSGQSKVACTRSPARARKPASTSRAAMPPPATTTRINCSPRRTRALRRSPQDPIVGLRVQCFIAAPGACSVASIPTDRLTM